MKIVVDANVVIAALVKSSITREVLLYPYIDYYSPAFLLSELKEHEAEVLEKVGNGYKIALNLILTNLTIMPDAFYEPYLKEAHKIIGPIDKDDEAYIALALSLEADGVWSYDPHFRKQSEVETFSTGELILLMKSGLI